MKKQSQDPLQHSTKQNGGSFSTRKKHERGDKYNSGWLRKIDKVRYIFLPLIYLKDHVLLSFFILVGTCNRGY